MPKTKSLKILLIVVAVLILSATAYGFWKIIGDTGKTPAETTGPLGQPKAKSEAVLPALPEG